MTRADVRAVRRAWRVPGPSLVVVITMVAIATIEAVRYGALVFEAAGLWLAGGVALVLVARHHARSAILRADLIGARLTTGERYVAELKALGAPARLWRALGAPTPEQRMRMVQRRALVIAARGGDPWRSL